MFQQVNSRIFPTGRLVKNRLQIVLSLMSVMLVACGSDDSDPASPLRTGVFLDAAPVEGLGYETATMRGKTNLAGEFSFNAGETITFTIGNFSLPALQAANSLTPKDIFGATDVTEPEVADLSRLLQSLDVDSDASNGILLPLTVDAIASDTVIDFGGPNFDTQAAFVLSQVNESQNGLVDVETAVADLTDSLIENELINEDCTSAHPLVNSTAELSMLEHGVSGTIKVINDCVIEVSNFNYDGGGPDVFFYAAADRAYGADSFMISEPRLNGQQWVNDTVTLKIPEGKTLDDFNGLSVWCFRFGINFGDGFFNDS